jgi:membrane fusion protein, multidrug efflux system
MRPSSLAFVSLSLFPLLAIASCGASEAASRAAPAGPPQGPAVGVAEVEQRQLADTVELTGRIAAVESVELRPRVSGYLEAPRFEAGALVEKDQVLFQIDARWHKATLEQREAEVQNAEARLSSAESENARAAGLLETRAISAEEAEARSSRLREAKALLAGARAARESAALDLEYTTIRAPVKGRISRAMVTEGNFVSGIPAANTLLATIVSVDPLYVYADLDEASFLRFEHMRTQHSSAEQPLEIELALAGEQDYPHRARLESVDNRIDSGTGTMLLRGLVANPDGTIVPGMYTRLRVPLDAKEESLLVDERAIGTDQNQKFVLVVDAEGKAQYRRVELGPREGSARVIKSGLAAGERVIVTGVQKVRPGMPVQAGPLEPQTQATPESK